MNDMTIGDAAGAILTILTALGGYLKARATVRRWAEADRLAQLKIKQLESERQDHDRQLERDSRIIELKVMAEEARTRENAVRETLENVEKVFRRRVEQIERKAQEKVDAIEKRLDAALDEIRFLKDRLGGSGSGTHLNK